jgi:hypothetical protein
MGSVYRGCAREHINGIAWITDIATAGFFANRGTRANDPVIATDRIAINDTKVYVASQERKEFEIVCRPTITNIEPQTPDMLNAIMAARQAAQVGNIALTT